MDRRAFGHHERRNITVATLNHPEVESLWPPIVERSCASLGLHARDQAGNFGDTPVEDVKGPARGFGVVPPGGRSSSAYRHGDGVPQKLGA